MCEFIINFCFICCQTLIELSWVESKSQACFLRLLSICVYEIFCSLYKLKRNLLVMLVNIMYSLCISLDQAELCKSVSVPFVSFTLVMVNI